MVYLGAIKPKAQSKEETDESVYAVNVENLNLIQLHLALMIALRYTKKV